MTASVYVLRDRAGGELARVEARGLPYAVAALRERFRFGPQAGAALELEEEGRPAYRWTLWPSGGATHGRAL